VQTLVGEVFRLNSSVSCFREYGGSFGMSLLAKHCVTLRYRDCDGLTVRDGLGDRLYAFVWG
jgi:hypothetical protein